MKRNVRIAFDRYVKSSRKLRDLMQRRYNAEMRFLKLYSELTAQGVKFQDEAIKAGKALDRETKRRKR